MMPVIRVNLPGLLFDVPSYGLFAVLAFLAGALLFGYTLRKSGFSPRTIRMAVLISVAAFLFGARLLNLFLHPEAFLAGFSPWSLEFTNFSLYGGILAVALGLAALIRMEHLDGWRLLDAAVLPFTAAFTFARIGCHLNGCCAGKMTASPLGLPFPAAQTAARQLAQLTGSNALVPLGQYPTQLYELVLAITGLMMISGIQRLRRRIGRAEWPVGTVFLMDAIWFTAMRWAILPLRDYPYQPIVTRLLYPAMYVIIIVMSAILLSRRIKLPFFDH